MNTYNRLTPDNAAMLLIDHQEGFFPGIKSIDPAELRNNVIALGELAKALDMPTVLTASFPSGINGPVIPELVQLFPNVSILDRHLVNSWEDPEFVALVEATGRRKLIMSAQTTDVCLVSPAISAVQAGYEVYAVIDASGAWSKRSEDACILRMNNAGVQITSWVSIAAELLYDHLGPYKKPIQGVFDKHLFGYNEAAEKAA
ncbi:MAG: isochorismatase family protein [Bryobacteraceae bacterium]|nr:isochorismatase family protein [Bryobacteraceae bacterium]